MHRHASLVCYKDAICTIFATSASLRCTGFELYAFRSDIITTRQNFAQCITASRASKKYVQKSLKLLEMALSMIWLLDHSSAVKCKTVGLGGKPQPAWRAFENLDFHLQKVLRFMAFDVTLWKLLMTPREKEKNVHANSDPWISKNNYHWKARRNSR